jgi:hypothetical protein
MAIDWGEIFRKRPDLEPPGYWESVKRADEKRKLAEQQARLAEQEKKSKKNKKRKGRSD